MLPQPPSATPSGASSSASRGGGAHPSRLDSADAAAAAATALGAEDGYYDDDDDDGGAGAAGGRGNAQSPLSVWFSLFVRLLTSLLSTALTALVFLFYPLYCVVPRVVLEGLFKGVFRLGYLVYLTRVGAWLHARNLPAPNAAPHSAAGSPAVLSTASVHVVPILDNNYAYVLVDAATRTAAVVDPADPAPVLRAVRAVGATLTHILTTHRHHDHAGACARASGWWWESPACARVAPCSS